MKNKVWIFFLLFSAAWLIYQPGLHGDFIFDDYPNIVNNQTLVDINKGQGNLTQAFIFKSVENNRGRPVSMLSFAANISLTGFNAYWLKFTNLVIHVLNAFFLFLFSRELLFLYSKNNSIILSENKIYLVSAISALFWLVHPINLTSVLYVVQRMNSLSTFFVISGLWIYSLILKKEIATGKLRNIARLFVIVAFTSLAYLSKENGALFPIYVILLELAILDNQSFNRIFTRKKIFYYFIFILLAVITVYFSLDKFGYLDAYEFRDFGLIERLLTQTRVIWFYIYVFLFPNQYNVNLYYDSFAVSRSLFLPVTTFLSILALFFTALLIIYTSNKHRIMAFCILFFFCGHLIESTIIPLELVYLHRNYLPSMGLSLLTVLIISNYIPVRLARYGLPVMFIFVLLNAITTYQVSEIWGNPYKLSYSELLNNPKSYRANYQVARDLAIIYAKEKNNDSALETSFKYFENSSEYNEATMQPLLTLIMLSTYYGKPVKDSWLMELKKRASTKPFVAGERSALELFLNCLAIGNCKMKDEILQDIFYAIEKNPLIKSNRGTEMKKLIEQYQALH